MATRRLDDGQRNLTLEERVNAFAGEDALSDSDAKLDMMNKAGGQELSFGDFFAADAEEAEVVSISSDTRKISLFFPDIVGSDSSAARGA